jgi:type IV pilus assembly protein PilC
VPVIGAFRRKLFQLRAAVLLGAAAGQDRQFAAAALTHLGATAENRRLASWVRPLAQRVADGGDLLGAVRQTPEVPRRIAAILELGAKTADAGAARIQIEAWCEAELETGLPRFQTNVLALSYLVLGIVLGFVVIALYLPIFKLGAAI